MTGPFGLEFAVSDGVAERMGRDGAFAKFIAKSLLRFNLNDWGEVSEGDKEANDAALEDGGRVFAAYQYPGTEVWIITEADRSLTTCLYPEEY